MVDRSKINWEDDEELLLVKALAWYWMWEQRERNASRLLNVVFGELPKVSKYLMGVVWDRERCEQIVRDQGPNLVITPNHIYQRGEKADRYQESDFFKAAVVDYYEKQDRHWLRDPRRDFSDAEIEQAMAIHGDNCFFCESPLNGSVVGDHYIPHSKGGPTEQHNCMPACVKCNEEKRDLWPHLYGMLIAERRARGRKLGAAAPVDT